LLEGASGDAPKNFFGSAVALPSRKLPFQHSPITIRYSLPFYHRQSLFAAVSRLADLPISRFADKIRLGRSLALPFKVKLIPHLALRTQHHL
jgi:hypothetical protein